MRWRSAKKRRAAHRRGWPAYLWRVRRKPSYWDWGHGWSRTPPMDFLVVDLERQGTKLRVYCNHPRPDVVANWDDEKRPLSVTPGQAAQAVRAALGAGWEPAVADGFF